MAAGRKKETERPSNHILNYVDMAEEMRFMQKVVEDSRDPEGVIHCSVCDQPLPLIPEGNGAKLAGSLC